LYQPLTYLCFKLSEEIVITLLHSFPVSVIMYYVVGLQARSDPTLVLPRAAAHLAYRSLLIAPHSPKSFRLKQARNH
jgi:hypothetical protein